MTLPRTGPVHSYASMRDALDKDGFLRALSARGVLIRLDERGGDDEGAPWAFHHHGSIPSAIDVVSTDDDKVFASVPQANPVESTMTGPVFSLSVPAARGQATAHVLPFDPVRSDVLVGRGDDCDVRVLERSVSKHHARIFFEDALAGLGKAGVVVVDAGSQNGVLVNGRKVAVGARLPLLSGFVLELGDVAFVYLDPIGFYDGLPKLMTG